MIRLRAAHFIEALRRDRLGATGFVAAWLFFFASSPCFAQVYVGRPLPRAGSVEIAGGGVAAAGEDLPDVAASLTRNPGTGTGGFDLFQSDPSLTTAFGVHARVGVYVSPRIAIEGGVQYSRPKIEVRLSGDFEDADTTTATEDVTSYLFTGSVLYHFGRATSQLRPFVIAGGGHIRDVHAENSVVDTGGEFHAGAGFKWWLTKGRGSKIGLRADVLASVRNGGIGTEDGRRVVPTAAFSLAYLF